MSLPGRVAAAARQHVFRIALAFMCHCEERDETLALGPGGTGWDGGDEKGGRGFE